MHLHINLHVHTYLHVVGLPPGPPLLPKPHPQRQLQVLHKQVRENKKGRQKKSQQFRHYATWHLVTCNDNLSLSSSDIKRHKRHKSWRIIIRHLTILYDYSWQIFGHSLSEPTSKNSTCGQKHLCQPLSVNKRSTAQGHLAVISLIALSEKDLKLTSGVDHLIAYIWCTEFIKLKATKDRINTSCGCLLALLMQSPNPKMQKL